MKRTVGLVVTLALGCTVATRAAETTGGDAAREAAVKALEGMVSFSHKNPYSEAISDMYLGYDATGKPRVAVVLRSFKTYAKVTAMAVVKEKDGAWVIEGAAIPDIGVIKDPSKQKNVTDAIQQIAGKTVKDVQGKTSGVDAVTGATRYRSRIYESFDLMVRRALEEVAKNPDWPKAPVAAR